LKTNLVIKSTKKEKAHNKTIDVNLNLKNKYKLENNLAAPTNK
jgi:hypothetical protein